MSTLAQSSFAPSSSTPTVSNAPSPKASYHVFQAATPNGALSRTASTSEAPTPAPQVDTTNSHVAEEKTEPVVTVNVQAISDEAWRKGKQKGRRAEEVEAMAQTATRIATRLAADHAAVLHPDVETPFENAADVVKRLLPYHIYQHPLEDLLPFAHPNGKGKGRATEEDLLREEIAETRFALQCWKRKRALERRFRDIRTRAGQRNAPDDQAYILANCVVEADRAENTALNTEYRTARSELETIERKRKQAQAQAVRATPTPANTSARPPARSVSQASPTIASYSSATFPATPTYSATASTTTQAYSQYRGYTYPYPQTYASPYTYSPYANTAANASSYTSNAQTYTQAQPLTSTNRDSSQGPAQAWASSPTAPEPQASSTHVPASGAVPTAPTQAATPVLVPATPTAPIPVLLPVAALTTLSGMGIIPVPLANAPPVGQPQPAAVIKGTTQNGTMVSLDINVSALQATQAGALAVLLSALTSRGTNVSGSAAAGATVSASTPVSSSVVAGARVEAGGSANGVETREAGETSLSPAASASVG